MRGYTFFFLSIFRHHNWTHFLLPADIFIISNELLSVDKDVSTLILKESLSIAQCGAFKIELSGINEPILPRRPLTPPSLFVQLNVFTVSFSAQQGGLPGSLGGTGNSQAAPPAGGREKFPFYPSLCVKVISSGNNKDRES